MKFKPSSRYRQSSNAYATFSNRLNEGVRHWHRSVSNNDASVKQSDNGERRTRWLAASDTLVAAGTGWTGLESSTEMREMTLKRGFLASAGFFYKTPPFSTTGIVKMVRTYFLAALNTIATLTKKLPRQTQSFETHSLYGRGRLLKILVSAVRFCPEPPLSPLRSH